MKVYAQTHLPRRAAVRLACALVALCATGMLAATPSLAYWKPPAKPTWYWQLSGTVNNNENVQVYDIDGFENSAEEVATLHSKGVHVVCYIDAGGAEKYRPDYGRFLELEKAGIPIMGAKIGGWPEERWINVRELAYLEPIMKARFEMCKAKGFDAVEPDEIEVWAESAKHQGIKPAVTKAQQLAYNEWIAETVHSLGMAVLQKNDGAQTSEEDSYFDGALTEQCNQYSECGDFEPYLAAGEPVINAEYSEKTSKFCAKDEAAGIMGARFNLALNGKRFEPCW
jgi:hypothetical protein